MNYKTISSTLYLAIILPFIFPLENAYAQFGSIELGDTKQDVMKVMKEPLSYDEGDVTEHLKYEDKLDGMNVTVKFEFLDDKLIRNSIRILDTYSTDEFYKFYYDRIDRILQEKYGSPTNKVVKFIEEPVTTKPPLKENKSYKEEYLLKNNFKIYMTRWELESIEISHKMGGIFGELMHVINYSIPEYEKIKKSALIDKF